MNNKIKLMSILAVATMALCSCSSKDSTTEATTTSELKTTTEISAETTTTDATELSATEEIVADIPDIINATASDALCKMQVIYTNDKISGRTDNIYDNHNNLIEAISYCRDGVTPYRHVVYEYDSNNNCISERAYMESKKDVNEYVYKNEYNDKNQLAKQTKTIGTSDAVTYTVYEYDANGNVTKKTDCDAVSPNLGYIEYKYDANGNMISETTYSADGTISLMNEYIYENGVNTKINVSDGKKIYAYRTFEYDSNSKMSKEEIYFDDRLDHYIEYTYDKHGNMLTSKTIYDETRSSIAKFSY